MANQLFSVGQKGCSPTMAARVGNQRKSEPAELTVASHPGETTAWLCSSDFVPLEPLGFCLNRIFYQKPSVFIRRRSFQLISVTRSWVRVRCTNCSHTRLRHQISLPSSATQAGGSESARVYSTSLHEQQMDTQSWLCLGTVYK